MSHPPMMILGADHAGFRLKEMLKKDLQARGYDITDLTPRFVADDDYPPIAQIVARTVLAQEGLGLLVCGTGMGMDIAANREPGIRAIVARTPKEARLSREHNHANILVLGAAMSTTAEAKKILHLWLHTKYSKQKRHVRRVRQLG